MDERKYIDEAVSAFRALLEEQIKRQDRMAAAARSRGGDDKGSAEREEPLIIGIASGDGIGPVIMGREGFKDAA